CQLLKQSVSSLKGEKIKPRVEVYVRLDFLPQNAIDDAAEPRDPKATRGKKSAELEISIPRETASYVSKIADREAADEGDLPFQRAAAFIPLKYVSDAHQRIELYRKFAELND